eukprot:2920182-Prymnesium_polylepis.1
MPSLSLHVGMGLTPSSSGWIQCATRFLSTLHSGRPGCTGAEECFVWQGLRTHLQGLGARTNGLQPAAIGTDLKSPDRANEKGIAAEIAQVSSVVHNNTTHSVTQCGTPSCR